MSSPRTTCRPPQYESKLGVRSSRDINVPTSPSLHSPLGLWDVRREERVSPSCPSCPEMWRPLCYSSLTLALFWLSHPPDSVTGESPESHQSHQSHQSVNTTWCNVILGENTMRRLLVQLIKGCRGRHKSKLSLWLTFTLNKYFQDENYNIFNPILKCNFIPYVCNFPKELTEVLPRRHILYKDFLPFL